MRGRADYVEHGRGILHVGYLYADAVTALLGDGGFVVALVRKARAHYVDRTVDQGIQILLRGILGLVYRVYAAAQIQTQRDRFTHRLQTPLAKLSAVYRQQTHAYCQRHNNGQYKDVFSFPVHEFQLLLYMPVILPFRSRVRVGGTRSLSAWPRFYGQYWMTECSSIQSLIITFFWSFVNACRLKMKFLGALG